MVRNMQTYTSDDLTIKVWQEEVCEGVQYTALSVSSSTVTLSLTPFWSNGTTGFDVNGTDGFKSEAVHASDIYHGYLAVKPGLGDDRKSLVRQALKVLDEQSGGHPWTILALIEADE
jgi:hypothetical protein